VVLDSLVLVVSCFPPVISHSFVSVSRREGYTYIFLFGQYTRFSGQIDFAISILLSNQVKMKSYIVAALAAFASSVSAADGVKGAAEGFAKGTYLPNIFFYPTYHTTMYANILPKA
jgi:hypothetical protein